MQSNQPKRTPLYEKHCIAHAKLVDFAGWEMPIQYPAGIVQEHLATRRSAGLFDVSHMGRFRISGNQAGAFLDYALTNYAGGLGLGMSHYTILAQEDGGAVDDAWLYRFESDNFILVVNASNKDKDWTHLESLKTRYTSVILEDLSESLAMMALQGPQSEAILQGLLTDGVLPEPKRNATSLAALAGYKVLIGRTGYTGETVCFEIMIQADKGGALWDILLAKGVAPIGLGARDTLRLEASLPLYGHEMGQDSEGKTMPILACSTARFAVADSEKKNYVGKAAIQRQLAALERYKKGDFSDTSVLPKRVVCLRILDKGIARQGSPVFYQGRLVGVVTSGTSVPYWKYDEAQKLTEQYDQRSVAMAYVDCQLTAGAEVQIEVRGKMLGAKIVKRNLKPGAAGMMAVFE